MPRDRNRVAVVMSPCGDIKEVASDDEIDVFIVDDKVPDDRVYQLEHPNCLRIGCHAVDEVLADSPIGHAHDWCEGPRPSRNKLTRLH